MNELPAVNMCKSRLSARICRIIRWTAPFVLLLLASFCAADIEALPETELDGFAFSGHILDISARTADARTTCWKPDGSMMYVVGRATNNVVAYELADPWDISSAEIRNNVRVPGVNQHGIYLKDDGKVMWIFDRTGMWAFELEEAWDISTLLDGTFTDFSGFLRLGHDFDFGPEGESLFIDDRSFGAVFEVGLKVPWDISTGELRGKLDVSDRQIAVRGIEFMKKGGVMLLLDTGRSEILQYSLSEPYDIETAQYDGAFDLSGQTRNPRGLSLSRGLDAFYVTCNTSGRIFQYNAKPDEENSP